MFKKWLPNRVHKVSLFSGFCLLGHLWGPNPLFDIENGPQRSQSASNDRKLTQKWYQRAPRLRKRAPKDKPFRALRNIMKQKSAMTQHTRFYDYEKSSPADCAKSDTEGPQKIKKRFQMCICWGTWPGGLREALSINPKPLPRDHLLHCIAHRNRCRAQDWRDVGDHSPLKLWKNVNCGVIFWLVLPSPPFQASGLWFLASSSFSTLSGFWL